jgi:hypothetical protein
MPCSRVAQVGGDGERALVELIPQHVFGELIHCGNYENTQDQHHGRINAADLPLEANASLFLIHLVSQLFNGWGSRNRISGTNSPRFLPNFQLAGRIRSLRALRKASQIGRTQTSLPRSRCSDKNTLPSRPRDSDTTPAEASRLSKCCGSCETRVLAGVYKKAHILFYFDLSNGKSPDNASNDRERHPHDRRFVVVRASLA